MPIIHVAAASAQGPREYNEDRCKIIQHNQHTYVAVFDGHAGHRAATIATERLHAHLQLPASAMSEAQSGHPVERDVADALRSAFVRTDADILADGTDAGCTAVVVLHTGSNHLYIAHVGDSRAILCGAAKHEQLTQDHKPQLPRERARVEARGGIIQGNRVVSDTTALAMTRALGDVSHKTPVPVVESRPDVGVVTLQPSDVCVLVATDGLWDYVSNEDAHSLALTTLQQHPTRTPTVAAAIARALVDTALARHTHDNVTVAVLLLD